MDERRKEMRFNWTPKIRRLRIIRWSQTSGFGSKLFDAFPAADMFDDRVGVGEIETAIGKLAQAACVAAYRSKTRILGSIAYLGFKINKRDMNAAAL